MTIQHRTRRGAMLVAALSATALGGPAARAQSFPANPTWRSFTCGNAPMRDAVGDHPGAPGDRDVVGTTQAPAGLRAADAEFLYLRLRLDQDPRQGPNLRAGSSWGFAFSTDGLASGYEALVTVDGTTRTVALYRNTSVGLPDSPEDPADAPPVASYPFATHGQVQAADSALGAGADVFLDMAVPWSALAMVGVTQETTVVTWAASSTSPDRLNLDFACHDVGGGTTAPRLSESASTGERTGPGSSGSGGSGGPGGTGGQGGQGGIDLEGGPGCALGGRRNGAGLALALMGLLGLLLRPRRSLR